MKMLQKTLVAAGLVACLGASNALAQGSATTSANVSATIQAPITLTKVSDMSFGAAVASGSAGTVVLTPAGSRSATGGVSLAGGSVSPASFTVGGAPSVTYAITLPGSVTIDSGAATMGVGTFTSSPSSTGTIGVGGTQTLNVGATLTVGVSQANGTYTGSFNVTVAYN